jgi:hypothetical protein
LSNLPLDEEKTVFAKQMSFPLELRSLCWYLLGIAGGAAVLFGSFFVTVRMIDAANIDILEAARQGAWLNIQLDAKVCRAGLVGVLRCDVTYNGRYTRVTNTWKVIGEANGQMITASYDNAPNEPGSISIFGLIAQSDRNGKLRLQGVENAGTITLTRPIWHRAFFSETNLSLSSR